MIQAKFCTAICDELRLVAHSITRNRETRSVCLTGGRSAKVFYENSEARKLLLDNFTHFYLSDERCVEPEHSESNFQLVFSSLFLDNISSRHRLYQMYGKAVHDPVKRYTDLIPDSFEVLLLSVGEDGHIASLFPGSSALEEYHNKVVLVSDSPKPPRNRLSITLKVIRSAKNIIVMAAGTKKGEVLSAALKEPYNINQLPVRVTVGSTWILDELAADSFLKHAPSNLHNTRIIYA